MQPQHPQHGRPAAHPGTTTGGAGGYVTFDPPMPTGYGQPPVEQTGGSVGSAADEPAPHPDPGPWPPQPDPTPAPDPSAAGPAGIGDTDTVLPQPDIITLVSGTRVRVKKLRTRELLAVVGIAASGLGGQLGNLKLSANDSAETFMAKFAGLLLAAAFTPEGSDQVMAFLRMVCDPVGKVDGFRVDKAQQTRNKALDEALDYELANPHPDDTITIVEAIAAGNAGDLQAWGKRLAGIWTLAQRTGQIPASRTSQG